MTTLMERIVIIGVTGAGKTTLAFNVAARLGMPYTDLDDLYWRPGWQSAPEEEFRGDVAKAAAADRWVMTGNYLSARNVLWPRARLA
jgi:adenylate kinase family enzyme